MSLEGQGWNKRRKIISPIITPTPIQVSNNICRQKCKEESRRDEDQEQEEEEENNLNLFSTSISISPSHGINSSESTAGPGSQQKKHRANISKSFCSGKNHSLFLLVFAFGVIMSAVVESVKVQPKGIAWNPVDDSPTSTPTLAESSRQSSSPLTPIPSVQLSEKPVVATLQSMSSHPKTQRRKPVVTDENDVLPRLTFVDKNHGIGPPQVTYVENTVKNVIPTHTTYVELKNEIDKPTNKDEILVVDREEKAQSRPEDEKEIIIYDDIYPRRVKLSQWRQNQQQQQKQRHPDWRQQQKHRQDSERRRRYFVSPPWRHPGPPSASRPPTASGSTRYFLPPLRPHPRPPHEDQTMDNSFRTESKQKKQTLLAPPPPARPPRYRQLVPVEQDLQDDVDYEEYGDEYFGGEDANRRHDYNWWLGPQPTRRNQERGRSHSPNQATGGSNSLLRSIMGVSPFCLHDDIQFNCVLTPVCWMAGGETLTGCDSMLYSCCVEPSIARKDVVATGRGVQKRIRSDLVLRNEPECGITKHRQFSKRIIGGEKAQFAELPWQVHIRISSYQCGGVLLNHWYVATAAHCVHQAKLDQITVHLGEFDTKNSEAVRIPKKEPLDSESFEVESITLHPEFRYMLTQPDRFDIALLKLDHPVFYRDNIIPICLPTQDYSLTGKEGTVAGWGKTDNSFGKTGTNILNKVQVPVIDNRKCRRWHKEKAIAVQLHDEMFCAGYKEGQQDACLGDSGGPLVINFEGRWTLIGITSAGFGCAVEKQPGIYHKVSKTASWISRQINTPP